MFCVVFFSICASVIPVVKSTCVLWDKHSSRVLMCVTHFPPISRHAAHNTSEPARGFVNNAEAPPSLLRGRAQV